MTFDLKDLNGKWLNVIYELTNYSVSTKRNIPCPFCGGDDRFTYTNKHNNGTWLCRQCTPTGSDGIGFIARKLGQDRKEIFKQIARMYQFEAPQNNVVELEPQDNFVKLKPELPWDKRTLKNKTKPYQFKYVWNWYDEKSDFIGFVARLEFYSKKENKQVKIIWQIHYGCPVDEPDQVGWYQTSINPKPLFGYYPSLGRTENTPIIICEGEKTQSALRDLLIDSDCRKHEILTTQGGASQVACSDFEPIKNNREIYIWPDNDEAGFQYAKDISEILPQAKTFSKQSLEKLGLGYKQDAADLDQLSTQQLQELKNNASYFRN